MRLGETPGKKEANRSSLWDEMLFSLSGKPFDGWGPATSPAALGQIRTCEQNCYLSEGGDCCDSQGMCERGSCVEGSICDPDGNCIPITRPEFEDEYGGIDCTAEPEACLDYSDEPCPAGFMAQARECPKEVYYLCLQNAKTGQSSCKYLQKTSANYLKWCLNPFGPTCYNSKEECQSCNDCACRSSSSSSNCGSDTCTGCEFCCEDKCVGCNSIERYSGPCYQTGADSDCPYPLGQKDGDSPNSCGCHYSGLIGDGADRGCAQCEFCVWSAAEQGGLCMPCDKDPYTGLPYDPNTDNYKNQRWQCSEECMKISSSSSSKVCVWTFTANYDDQTQAWSFESPSPSGPKCLRQPLSYSVGSWFGSYSSDECKKKTFIMTTGDCAAKSDCSAPSPSEYPELPTQPAECGPWYSCDYSYDSATNITTYKCNEQASYNSDYYGSPEECEAAKESGSCISPTFDCKLTDYATGKLECEEVGFNAGAYKTIEECTQSLENSDCGYRFSCRPPAKEGDPYTCTPDSNGDFFSKSSCESNIDNCGKFKCDSGWGCKQDPYGEFTTKEECEKGCCTPTPGQELSPTVLGGCEYYQADGFSPLTPDFVVCEGGLTKAQCDAKPTITTLAGSWSPTWTCGSDCYASVNDCPGCASGRYKLVRTYPGGTPVCTCLG